MVLSLLCPVILSLFSFYPGNRKETGNLEILFEFRCGDLPFSPDSVYTNAAGEALSIRRMKFYMTGIGLSSASGHSPHSDIHYLVDATDRGTHILHLSFPTGSYTGLRFLLGVDSIYNVSGARSGALDPLNGMFWTWQTGYVMAKLEGNSPASPRPNGFFEYHIGGYKGEYKVQKMVELALPAGTSGELKKNQTIQLKIAVDLLSWFRGTENLSIARSPICTTPGPLALKIAGNYSSMFRILPANE